MEARREMALKEMMHKGKAMELSWFKNNFKRIYIDSGLHKEEIPKNAIILYNKLMEMETKMKEEREKRLQKEKESIIAPTERRWKPVVVTKWDLERERMLPVDPTIRDVLYSGVSHNDEGRRKYLFFRNIDAPYDKYYEPQNCGMDYGWKIEERGLPPNKQFTTAEVLKAEMYRRYGVKNETLRNRRPMAIGIVTPELL